MKDVILDTPTYEGATASPTALCGPALAWDEHDDLVWIRTEIDKTTDIPARPVDWVTIAEKAQPLLARSKDWVLLCAVARGAVETGGVSSLVPSINTLGAAAEAFWQPMHPALPRGLARRVNYLEWFVDGTAAALKSRGDRASRAEWAAAAECLATFDELMRSLVGPTYPGVRTLRDVLKDAIERSTPPEERLRPSPTPTPDTTESLPLTAVPRPASELPPIHDAESASRALSKVRETLFTAADALQAADATSPTPFRLRRMAAWLRVDEAPTAIERRISSPGPDEDKYERLRNALPSDPRSVLVEAEAVLQSFPLWLDANYLTYQALTRAGLAYRHAGNAVRFETLGLVSRLPELMDLEFSNGVPLASAETRDWLSTELSTLAASTASVESAPSSTEDGSALAAAERTADEFALRGDIENSFTVFDDGIREAASGRERFQWRLAAARHAARQSRADLALDLLEGLDREASELRLDLWEPALWAAVLTTAIDLRKKNKRERMASEIPQRLPDIEKRLARLDLMAALRLLK